MNSRPASIMMRETNASREARSSQPNDSSSLSNPDVGNEDEDEVQYITGVKLTLVVLAVIGVALLIMLDMSIIATVRELRLNQVFHVHSRFKTRQPLISRATFTLLPVSVGMEARTY